MRSNKYKLIRFILPLVAVVIIQGCVRDKVGNHSYMQKHNALFEKIDESESGIKFSNRVIESDKWNGVKYSYAYNGGGVAIGDLDNDGKQDIVFTSNQEGPQVYRNLGRMKFEDVTDKSGVNAKEGWTTGVTLADVNGDGWLDIYICKSGKEGGAIRENKLFINQHDFTFKEEGKEYGLNINQPSTQAVFFDYDHDGDLDCYILNHPDNFDEVMNPFGSTDSTVFATGEDNLMENVNGHFIDVTETAGLKFTGGFGLSASICDVNHDGLDDIYVANDYLNSDELFVNNGNKTFTNETDKYFTQVSLFSMGSDYADINNDGKPDLITVDMKPDNHYRTKRNLVPFTMAFYNCFLSHSTPPQYIKNTLQLATDTGKFDEVAQLLGVDKTDWSWSALIQDFDNDGWNDIHITSGTKRDILDLDFLMVQVDQNAPSSYALPARNLYKELKTTKLHNYIYHNEGGLKFEDVSSQWDVDFPCISNGAAYGDLDGDGYVDLVVNNTDEPATLFKNRGATVTHNNYLRLKLSMKSPNTFAVGARATVYTAGFKQTKELRNGRGFESCSEPFLHFGIGRSDVVDSVLIKWPDGKKQVLRDVKANELIAVSEPDSLSRASTTSDANNNRLLQQVNIPGLRFKHSESDFNDFKRDRMIPFKYSRLGPALATADVNGDHIEDVFIGNAAGHTAKLFIQDNAGHFKVAQNEPWEHDSTFETMGCTFFDFNGDGAPDLYIAVGSNEYLYTDANMKDRLYINDGHGNYRDASNLLQFDSTAHSVVISTDIDGKDYLFVGGFMVPGEYPTAGKSHLYRNDHGKLTDVTDAIAPGLKDCGMVNTALWMDYDKDGKTDLVVAGDWMPVKFFHNENGKFMDRTRECGTDSTNGFWKSLKAVDIDGDGDLDLVAGNLGENTFLKASKAEPITLWLNDFDDNGTLDPIMFYYLKGKSAPFADRNVFCEQMPKFRNTFLTYESYAKADWQNVFSPEQMRGSKKFAVYNTCSCWFENNGHGKFIEHMLPVPVQAAPIFGIITYDFNEDGKADILLNGNWFSNYFSSGDFDAFRGLVLQNDGKGKFEPLDFGTSGFYNDQDGKAAAIITAADKSKLILITNNNGPLKVFKSAFHKKQGLLY